MATDLSEFDNAKRSPGNRLKVTEILNRLPKDKADKLRAALEQPDKYSNEVVSVVLKGWGEPCCEGAVRTWRKKHDL